MKESARTIPECVNAKLVIRHSIRQPLRTNENPYMVPLTDEGICLARHFGRGLNISLGYVLTSRALRCIQTVESIIEGSFSDSVMYESIDMIRLCASNEVDNSILLQRGISAKRLIAQINSEIEIPGLLSINQIVKNHLDIIFSNGGAYGTLDVFCTHDFQMMVLLSSLFDKVSDIDSIRLVWPRMLEGFFFWGERNDFYCSWRNRTKHYVGLLM